MLPANFRVSRVDRSSDGVLGNLFQHYLHDMAEWFDIDTGTDGRYAYPTETIWDKGLDVFFVYAGAIPIGFAVVGSAEAWTGDAGRRDLHEFFVIRRYRRNGVGQALANHIWSQYRGPWLVRVYQGNLPAVPFWRRVVGAYAATRYREEARTVNGRQWSYFSFEGGAGFGEARPQKE